ncbi:MAG TPA: DUF2933 domain-containing protein [Phenylobacterium sp.]|nr:DUF2933 domain-containing protein [Phenylobacterium sp.]
MSDRMRGFLQMALLAVVSAALFWLLREHWNHVFGYLPYVLFLACPLMHLFHHHGHGHDHHGQMQDRRDQPPAG